MSTFKEIEGFYNKCKREFEESGKAEGSGCDWCDYAVEGGGYPDECPICKKKFIYFFLE